MKKTERLDRILIRRGWATQEQVTQALKRQQRTGGRLGSILVDLGIISETQLAEALAEQFGTPIWDPASVAPDHEALRLFPEPWSRQKGVVPLAYDPEQKALRVAVSDPHNVVLADEIRFHANVRTLTLLVAPQVSLRRLLDRFYSGSRSQAPIAERLDLEFGFSAGPAEAVSPESQIDAKPAARVLLWLTQPFVAKLLKSLLEVERCEVSFWDALSIPGGNWDYLVYDNDNALCHPECLPKIKRALPRLQLIRRPSWVSALLRSPLSYEQMRDGYLKLAEFTARGAGQAQVGGKDMSRYALALARILSLEPMDVDTLMAACALAPAIRSRAKDQSEHESLAQDLGAPYPVADIYRAATRSFDQLGLKPGQSTPDAPFTARVYAVVSAFIQARTQNPVDTIEAAGELAESLRLESGSRFDPLAVEALLRIVREEVLEGYLPPGPSEVLLVSDHPLEWNHLLLLLENEGWRVVTAGSASEARALVERRRPDAVVWAASGAIEWIQWSMQLAPGITSFLLVEEFDSALARTALETGYEDVWSGNWDAGVAAAKLRRAVQKNPRLRPSPETVTGSLGQMSFIDMVQILAAGARSVRIDLAHEHAAARVILWQGQIKYAEAAEKQGEEAIYEILKWPDATFAFRPVDTAPSPNCRLPNEAILLEGCRLIDEKRHAEKSNLPGTVTAASPAH